MFYSRDPFCCFTTGKDLATFFDCKGRVERQVLIVRDHVLAGRAFSSVEELNAAFTAWVPL
ncbi:hypothetical protein [Streptomyces virginiae]